MQSREYVCVHMRVCMCLCSCCHVQSREYVCVHMRDVFVFMLGNENWITFWVIRVTCNPGNMYVCTCVCVCVCVHVG